MTLSMEEMLRTVRYNYILRYYEINVMLVILSTAGSIKVVLKQREKVEYERKISMNGKLMHSEIKLVIPDKPFALIFDLFPLLLDILN